MTDRTTQVVWLSADTRMELQINENDQVRLEFGPSPRGVVLVADRYELHKLIIEIDKRLSRYIRGWS